MRRWLTMAPWLLATACGGGSGGDGGPSLTGEFYVTTLEAEADPAADATSSWGTALSDGGSLSLLTATNTNGIVSVPGAGVLGLDAASDGTIEILEPFGGEVVLRGCVGAGGTVAVAASVRAGDRPAVLALVRRWTATASQSDLSGDYHAVFFAYDGAARSVTSTATFDGAGNGTIETGGAANLDGVVSPITFASQLDFGVDSDGTLNLSTTFGGLTFQGGLDPSGDVAILGGSTSTSAPSMFFFVRASAAAGPATLQGDYGMAGLALDYVAPAMRSFAGRLVADGLGGATMEGTTNEEGSLTSDPPAAVPYAVAPDGTLVVTLPGGTVMQGAVSPGGDFAILGGGTTGGSDPQFYVLVRR